MTAPITLIDRPAEKGGADSGPMGGELFLIAVEGCCMSNLPAAIKAREAKASDVRTEVIGTMVDSPARFAVVELYVTAEWEPNQDYPVTLRPEARGNALTNTATGMPYHRLHRGHRCRHRCRTD
jgi:putative redox protein